MHSLFRRVSRHIASEVSANGLRMLSKNKKKKQKKHEAVYFVSNFIAEFKNGHAWFLEADIGEKEVR